ncbi:WASH complex subunit 2 [Frankliniella fusca]|uniref:WASH complex subunit 2 n=1 Tax=Frankliniella fusca TaxID=407009 RepID=A0AAE1H5H0_9NEOP|nr:WASH complex subunit 2 [Frankliniella fusca]
MIGTQGVHCLEKVSVGSEWVCRPEPHGPLKGEILTPIMREISNQCTPIQVVRYPSECGVEDPRGQIEEPSRAEPSRAEPSRAEPSRAEPSRAEPSGQTVSTQEGGTERLIHLAVLFKVWSALRCVRSFASSCLLRLGYRAQRRAALRGAGSGSAVHVQREATPNPSRLVSSWVAAGLSCSTHSRGESLGDTASLWGRAVARRLLQRRALSSLCLSRTCAVQPMSARESERSSDSVCWRSSSLAALMDHACRPGRVSVLGLS